MHWLFLCVRVEPKLNRVVTANTQSVTQYVCSVWFDGLLLMLLFILLTDLHDPQCTNNMDSSAVHSNNSCMHCNIGKATCNMCIMVFILELLGNWLIIIIIFC